MRAQTNQTGDGVGVYLINCAVMGAAVRWQRMRRCHHAQLSILIPTFYRQVHASQVTAKKNPPIVQ
jgi:hypothetical protein